MIQIWWLAAIIAQERAASGADKRNAILAPNLLENTSHVSSKPNLLENTSNHVHILTQNHLQVNLTANTFVSEIST